MWISDSSNFVCGDPIFKKAHVLWPSVLLPEKSAVNLSYLRIYLFHVLNCISLFRSSSSSVKNLFALSIEHRYFIKIFLSSLHYRTGSLYIELSGALNFSKLCNFSRLIIFVIFVADKKIHHSFGDYGITDRSRFTRSGSSGSQSTLFNSHFEPFSRSLSGSLTCIFLRFSSS